MQIQAEITDCFQKLLEILQSRERQLLRQAEAIYSQQLSLVETSMNSLPSSAVILKGRSDLEKQIRCFGNIEIHGHNGITVEDIQSYKVADYQDANKDHLSLSRIYLPHCKDPISDYKTLPSSSSTPTFFSETRLHDLQNIKNNSLLNIKDTLPLSNSSSFLIIKPKLDLIYASLDGLHAFDKIYSRGIQSFQMSCKTMQSDELDMLTNEEMDVNLQKINKETSDQSHFKLIKDIKEQEKSYGHPIQVQQWLQQILVQTETEPTIQEIGQFSEISKTKFCNKTILLINQHFKRGRSFQSNRK